VTLRVPVVSGILISVLAATSCGNDHQHPPFASGTCAVPPCTTPTSRGVGTAIDAGRPADAALDAADHRDR
jgi:hypothetical protein